MNNKTRKYKNSKNIIFAIVMVILLVTLINLGEARVAADDAESDDTRYQIIRHQILDDLIINDKKIFFPKTEIVIYKDGSRISIDSIIIVGIRNKKNAPLHYKIRFTPISRADGAPFSIDNPSWFQFAQKQVYELPATDSELSQIRLSIPTSVPSGSYFLTFDVVDNDLPPPNNIYAQEKFSIILNEKINKNIFQKILNWLRSIFKK